VQARSSTVLKRRIQVVNQLHEALKGVVTKEMEEVARAEDISPELLRLRVEKGQIVILKGRFKDKKTVGIGQGLRTKINASIGTSTDVCDIDHEVRKAQIAEQHGADTLMELSAAGDLDEVRRRVLEAVSLPVENVPLYQAFCETIKSTKTRPGWTLNSSSSSSSVSVRMALPSWPSTAESISSPLNA